MKSDGTFNMADKSLDIGKNLFSVALVIPFSSGSRPMEMVWNVWSRLVYLGDAHS